MAEALKPLDITNLPDLVRLAEEVRTTGMPRLLRRDREEIAMLVPVAPKRRRGARTRTKADYEALLASAGSWKDEDTDALIARIYESRDPVLRSPVGP